MIKKFKTIVNYFNKDIKFIFCDEHLNPNSTAREVGITNNSNIFVVKISEIIIFKIYGIKDINFPIIISLFNKNKISEIIDSFIFESGLSKTLILKYVFNSKILNESMTIEEAGLKNKSEIIVYIKNPLDYIFINFQSINIDKIDSNK